MPDAQDPNTPVPPVNPDLSATNLKSEMDRKLGNLETNLKKATDSLAQQLQALNQKYGVTQAAPPAPKTYKSFREEFYEDEDKAVENLTKRIKDDIKGDLGAINKQNQVLSQLYQKFPELGDVNNDLTKKATEIHQGLSEAERQSPMSFKVAVMEAAEELGVVPMGKRPKSDEENDSFTMGGNSRPAPSKTNPRGDLPPEMLEFAGLLGLDTSDPKVVDSIKANQRSSGDWQRYQPISRKK